MRQEEGRTIGLYFKVSPEEMALIEQKMEQAGTGNKRAYLRKMAVDGYIVHLDLGDLGQLIKLLRSVSNNVNQIARRCNETGNLYGEDVEDLRKGYMEVQMQVVGMVARFPAL
ncbi:MAG: MobC family plasmid mobilization relaxosome protein [Lachnospiraceae bacterium]|nr:MobC family plasmid mobilization relaxosome protein [Lachnospiraceae bacterium]